MKIIDYFRAEDPSHWLNEIEKCDWDAGQYLHELLQSDSLKELVGENTRVLLLTEGEKLISFCTLAEKDDIQPTDLTPWIGFVYTFPAFRGQGYAEKLMRHAEELAKADGADSVHVSTNHVGLYERYGYTFFGTMKDVGSEDSRVYVKHL